MTQQVFLNALQSISSFKWKGIPFSAWLFRIAHNQVVDYLRKKAKRATVPLDESQAISNSNPQLVAEHRLDIDQLVSATKRMTKAQREVIALRFSGELSTAEVSKVMGNAKQPSGKGCSPVLEGSDRLKGTEKDLLCHILCLCFFSYFENYITINPIEVLLIYLS